MQTKRMTFSSRWLLYALLAPQVIITLIFFVWPASQALLQSVYRQSDAFGVRPPTLRLVPELPGALFNDSILSQFAVGDLRLRGRQRPLLSMGVALLFAVMVNRNDPLARQLHDFSGLALRHRTAIAGGPVVVHLQPLDRHHALCGWRIGLQLEPPLQRHGRDLILIISSQPPGSRSATISCSSWQAFSRSPIPSSRPPQSMAPAA